MRQEHYRRELRAYFRFDYGDTVETTAGDGVIQDLIYRWSPAGGQAAYGVALHGGRTVTLDEPDVRILLDAHHVLCAQCGAPVTPTPAQFRQVLQGADLYCIGTACAALATRARVKRRHQARRPAHAPGPTAFNRYVAPHGD